MAFLKNQKTNWRYIAIVAVFALAVAGIFLANKSLWNKDVILKHDDGGNKAVIDKTDSGKATLTKSITTQKIKLFPDLVFARDYGLLRLIYDDSRKIYKEQTSYLLTNPISLSVLNDSVFAITKDTLIKLTADLKKEKELKFERAGSMVASGDNIFLSADGYFTTLNENLKKLSDVELIIPITGKAKNADDILIYKDMAYLLDNVFRPIYVFRVDIKNLKNIKINDRIDLGGANAHLDDQWIDSELNQWVIIQSQGILPGDYQTLFIYSISDFKEKSAKRVYFKPRDRDSQDKAYGIPIIGVESFSPWVVVLKEGAHYLAKINTRSEKVSFSDFIRLKEGGKRYGAKATVKRYKNYLFVTVDDFFGIIDIENKPRLILSQKFGGERIIDFDFAR